MGNGNYFNQGPFNPNMPTIPGSPRGGFGGFVPQGSNQVYTPAFQLPYYQQNRQNLQGMQNFYQNRGPSEFRGDQRALIDMLTSQSKGEGPSVAQDQLKQGSDRALKQQMAAAASQAGYQPQAAMQRQVAQSGAEGLQNLAAESGMLRANEMLAARQQLASAIEQARAQDQALNALNDQMVRQFVGQGLDLDQAQGMANMNLQQLLSGNQMQMNRMQHEINLGNMQRSLGAKDILGFVGGMFSDRKLKKEIVDAESDIHGFLDTIGG